MFDKLEAIERRHAEVAGQLGDPEVIGSQERWRELVKEHARLEKLVARIRAYRESLADLEAVREMMAEEADPAQREWLEEEFRAQEARRDRALLELKRMLVRQDPRDEKNVIMEIRAGTGGEEAALFAADLFRMYSRYAERQGWRSEVLSLSETGIGGVKEVIVSIEGEGAYSRLKYESGVHRVQRVPATEASGRIHTSTATVAVLPEAEEVDVEIRPEDLVFDTFRASGAGGQHVNKTESAVRITHIPTGIVVACQDERSQHKNRARALKILRAKLFELAREEQESSLSAERRAQVGSGERSEKIRTYNYQQARVTDHRIGLSLYKLEAVLDGDLDEILDALMAHFEAEALAQAE